MNIGTTDTPIGRLGLVEKDGMITQLLWNAQSRGEDSAVLREGARQLQAYFNHELTEFDLPLWVEGSNFQRAVCDVMAERVGKAMIIYRDMTGETDTARLVVAGGVAANTELRARLVEVAENSDFTLIAPPLKFCGDNAAMIAYAGLELFEAGQRDGMDLAARPRWPLDSASAPMLGSGKKGAKA